MIESGPDGALVGAPPVATATADPTRAAVTDILPHVVGLIPFALAIGAAGAANGLSLSELLAGGVLLLAGTAQLAAVELIGDGSGVALIVATTLVINLRFMLYGAGVNRWFADGPRRQRLALALPVVDQTYFSCADRFVEQTDLRWRRRYYLVATGLLVVAYLVGQIIGFRLTSNIPTGLGVHVAAPLLFAGMLGKALIGRAHLVAAMVAAVVVVCAAGLPGGAALPVAAIVGVAAGSTVGGGHDVAASEPGEESA